MEHLALRSDGIEASSWPRRRNPESLKRVVVDEKITWLPCVLFSSFPGLRASITPDNPSFNPVNLTVPPVNWVYERYEFPDTPLITAMNWYAPELGFVAFIVATNFVHLLLHHLSFMDNSIQ